MATLVTNLTPEIIDLTKEIGEVLLPGEDIWVTLVDKMAPPEGVLMKKELIALEVTDLVSKEELKLGSVLDTKERVTILGLQVERIRVLEEARLEEPILEEKRVG